MFKSLQNLLICYIISTLIQTANSGSWDEWWAYEGISGPAYWGLLNPEWIMCNKGKHQSPINIVPHQLLFDSNLSSVLIVGDKINGSVFNTGRGIVVQVAHDIDSTVILKGGPFSYSYKIEYLLLHYGHENARGSEHFIDGTQFPGELQIYAYNKDLYSNWTEAEAKAHGIAAIALLIRLTNFEHPTESQQLKDIISYLRTVSPKGQKQRVEEYSITALTNNQIQEFVTYEGSFTQPSCFENVQWIITNKPLYISEHQLRLLRNSLESKGLGDNFRPTQALGRRFLRTNINFSKEGKPRKDEVCTAQRLEKYSFKKVRQASDSKTF